MGKNLQSGPDYFGAHNPTRQFGNFPGSQPEFGGMDYNSLPYSAGTLPGVGDYYAGPAGQVTPPGMSIYGAGYNASGFPTAGGMYDMSGNFVVGDNAGTSSPGAGWTFNPDTGTWSSTGTGTTNSSVSTGVSSVTGGSLPGGYRSTGGGLFGGGGSYQQGNDPFYGGMAGGADLISAYYGVQAGFTGPNAVIHNYGPGEEQRSHVRERYLENTSPTTGASTMAQPMGGLIPGANYGNPTGAAGGFNMQNALDYYNLMSGPNFSFDKPVGNNGASGNNGGGNGGNVPSVPGVSGNPKPADNTWGSGGQGWGAGGTTGAIPGGFPANGIGVGTPSASGLNIGSGYTGSGTHLTDIYGKDLGGALQAFLKGGAGYNPQVAAALIAQMQPLEARGRAHILDSFGDEGLRFSSTAAIGLGDFESQFAANEQATLANLYNQSVDRYSQVLMGLTGAFQSANAADTNPMDWLNLALLAFQF